MFIIKTSDGKRHKCRAIARQSWSDCTGKQVQEVLRNGGKIHAIGVLGTQTIEITAARVLWVREEHYHCDEVGQ